MVVLRDPGEVFLAAPHRRARRDLVGRAHRPDHARAARPLRRPSRRADVAGRPRRARERLAATSCSATTRTGSTPDLTRARVARAAAPPPYNSFVILPDGHLVTKDFGGVLPGEDPSDARAAAGRAARARSRRARDRRRAARCPSRRSPGSRPTATRCTSSARTTLFRARWDGARLALDDDFAGRYRTVAGPDLRLGRGARARRGVVPRQRRGQRALRGHVPRAGHLAPRRCTSCASTSRPARCTLTEICGLPNGVVANPPVVDEERRIVVGYDSGNGVLAAFDIAADGSHHRRAGGATRTTRAIRCCSPTPASSSPTTTTPTRMADAIVVLDIETGDERVRVDAGSAVQSVRVPGRRLRPRLLLLLVRGGTRAVAVTMTRRGRVKRWP